MSAKIIKTGILGGTFDPIHIGHLRMAVTALKEYDLDELWLMPNGEPPHKEQSSVIASGEERLAMVRLAISDCLKKEGSDLPIKACDYEIKRSEKSYSYETMETFLRLYPEREFYFIIGADSLMNLRKWMKPERLVKTCIMLVAVRDDDDELDLLQKIEEYKLIFPGSDMRLLHMPRIDVSATLIRKNLKEGSDIADYVSPSVNQYIKEHANIYK